MLFRSLQQGPALLEELDPEGMARRWLASDPAQPEGWRRHQPPDALWRRPMLLIGGWHDPHLAGVLDLWQRAQAAGGSPELRIGAWSHLHWHGGIDAVQLDFFNRHLKGHLEQPTVPTAREPLLLQNLADHRWQAGNPRQSSGQRWALASQGLAAVDGGDGRLLESPPAGDSPPVVVVHDPWRPLPGRGGPLGLDAGPVERGDLDQRTDVACFTTAAATTAMELLGQPQLRIQASADQPGFDLCVALSVLELGGGVRQLSTGVARFLGEGCLEPQLRQVALQPLLLTLAPGERLRLSIGLAAWPQIAVNPGDGSPPQGGSGPAHRTISVELQLAGAELSIQPMVGAN